MIQGCHSGSRYLVLIARKAAPAFLARMATEMKERLDPGKVAPELMSAMLELEGKVRSSGLERSLIHLVKIRASQLNGCAYCVHMHV